MRSLTPPSQNAKHHKPGEDELYEVVKNPTATELAKWIKKSGKEARKFFNTSGQLYREMGLSAKLKDMSEQEMIDLLSTDGMLVKRPLLITDSDVLVGFKELEWEEKVL